NVAVVKFRRTSPRWPRTHQHVEIWTTDCDTDEAIASRFSNRSEVRRRNPVSGCGLVGRSDAKERRLGKRPSEEHDPDRKFGRNGPHQARTSLNGGIAHSIKHVRGESGRDRQCRKTVLSELAPDRICPA